jgi:hypothetical protein
MTRERGRRGTSQVSAGKPDSRPIIAKHDPFLVRTGLVTNPVLIKYLRVLARRVRYRLTPVQRAGGLLLAWIIFRRFLASCFF